MLIRDFSTEIIQISDFSSVQIFVDMLIVIKRTFYETKLSKIITNNKRGDTDKMNCSCMIDSNLF